jgi:hypothetical protein
VLSCQFTKDYLLDAALQPYLTFLFDCAEFGLSADLRSGSSIASEYPRRIARGGSNVGVAAAISTSPATSGL